MSRICNFEFMTMYCYKIVVTKKRWFNLGTPGVKPERIWYAWVPTWGNWNQAFLDNFLNYRSKY